MVNDTLYSQQDQERLEKYTRILDKTVDKLDAVLEEDMKKGDFRKVRLLLETINTSTESIHKQANNKAKAEANKSDSDVKLLIAKSLQELSKQKEKNVVKTDEDRTAMFSQIDIPEDTVDGETDIGIGYLEFKDLKRVEDE